MLTTRQCAVLGSPIEHSLSPAIHKAAYAHLGLDWAYGRYEVLADDLPEFVEEASGKGKVESFTVLYGRNGEAEHGVTMLRTEAGARTLARVPAQDTATLTHLTNMDRTPVGSIGEIAMAADGVPEWKAA